MSLLQCNIKRALHKAFNFGTSPYYLDNELDITGLAIASQDAAELQELAHELGFKDVTYDFVPNSKWSCININKIKVMWSQKCRQTLVGDIIYNILPGSWKGKDFHIDVLPSDIEVIVQPEGDIETSSNYVLLPHRDYYIAGDIASLVPIVKFRKKQLECINPKNLQHISINRKGIYINRKYRDRVDLITESPGCPIIIDYILTIIHKGEVLLREKIK